MSTFTYDIKTTNKDNRSAICLLICHLLYCIINIFSSTFLIAHIYNFATDIFSYVKNVAIFQISTYVVMFLAYFLFSFVVDKTNRIWVYRIGNILNTGLVIITIFYGKNLAEVIILSGVLKGLAEGAYYSSYNVLKQEMISRKLVNKYAIIFTSLGKVVSIVCPILLGLLIDISTFSMVAIYVCLICIVLIILSFFVKAKRPAESNFNLKEYFKRLKSNKQLSKKIKLLYMVCIFFGASTITQTLVNVNIMLEFGSNFSLGVITSIFSVISIVYLIIFNKFTKQGKRTIYWVISSILLVISSIVFAILPNVVTLIIYNLFVTLTEIVVSTMIDIYRNQNLKESGLYQDIAEHQCVIESIFQITRILTHGLLIVCALIKNYIVFQVMFVIFICIYSITNLMLLKYEKYLKDEETKE